MKIKMLKTYKTDMIDGVSKIYSKHKVFSTTLKGTDPNNDVRFMPEDLAKMCLETKNAIEIEAKEAE